MIGRFLFRIMIMIMIIYYQSEKKENVAPIHGSYLR